MISYGCDCALTESGKEKSDKPYHQLNLKDKTRKELDL